MILDALTHVTPDGSWFSSTHDARLPTLLRQMDATSVERAAVVGLPQRIPNSFVLEACRSHRDRLAPVASFDPTEWDPKHIQVEARSRLQHEGFLGVKLHPRLSRFDPLDARVLAFLDELSQWAVRPAIWLCTFFHYPGGTLRKSPVETTHELVGRYSNLRFVLAHGGGPDLLRLATAVRACENAMLDLSFTLVRFAGSSVEIDLRHLLRTFDRRLLFGSDFPEVAIPEARAAFERMSNHAKAARTGVLGANLLRFIPELGSPGASA